MAAKLDPTDPKFCTQQNSTKKKENLQKYKDHPKRVSRK